jgi:RNA polymerase sigma-70 factor (ECF subfamily)
MDDSIRPTESSYPNLIVPPDDLRLIEALRQGDEAAFTALVNQYYQTMLRIALMYVNDRATAEEVVQETWIGVLRGLDRFEGRSSLKTWIFSILTNRAKTRGQREGRYVSLTALQEEAENFEPAVSSDRFRPADDPQWAGHWLVEPQSWDTIPEDHLLSNETQGHIFTAIAGLPPGQREVIRLRDVEGWSSEEVCNVLDISETNQRVLLHRARSKVRRALEQYLRE